MKKFNPLFFFTLVVITLVSCESQKDDLADARFREKLNEAYRYYPLHVGSSWTYSIDSIYYSDNLGKIEIDTVRGTYRETLTDTFRTEGGALVYRCIKEKQDPVTSGWNTLRVYSLTFSERQLVRTEENTPLIDLVFPLEQRSSWDPCAYIDANANYLVRGKVIQLFKDWPSAYIDRIYNEEYLGAQRDMVEIVDVRPDENIILYQSSRRKYAKDLGLVYKEQVFFTTQRTELAGEPWEEKAEIGFKAYQTLIDYKKE